MNIVRSGSAQRAKAVTAGPPCILSHAYVAHKALLSNSVFDRELVRFAVLEVYKLLFQNEF